MHFRRPPSPVQHLDHVEPEVSPRRPFRSAQIGRHARNGASLLPADRLHRRAEALASGGSSPPRTPPRHARRTMRSRSWRPSRNRCASIDPAAGDQIRQGHQFAAQAAQVAWVGPFGRRGTGGAGGHGQQNAAWLEVPRHRFHAPSAEKACGTALPRAMGRSSPSAGPEACSSPPTGHHIMARRCRSHRARGPRMRRSSSIPAMQHVPDDVARRCPQDE